LTLAKNSPGLLAKNSPRSQIDVVTGEGRYAFCIAFVATCARIDQRRGEHSGFGARQREFLESVRTAGSGRTSDAVGGAGAA
jgi:hypothetical protein